MAHIVACVMYSHKKYNLAAVPRSWGFPVGAQEGAPQSLAPSAARQVAELAHEETERGAKLATAEKALFDFASPVERPLTPLHESARARAATRLPAQGAVPLACEDPFGEKPPADHTKAPRAAREGWSEQMSRTTSLEKRDAELRRILRNLSTRMRQVEEEITERN
ncbi:MAG: hypothetical protein FWD69_08545 [Polyangiaceae bacterium]|nr:hypothetical protein [Polyangiaceae bacterium]